MKLCLTILILSCFVSHLLADLYTCAGTQTINRPANIDDTWYYPTNWNSSQTTQQFAANQNCTWIINVPKGMYALFNLKVDISNDTILTVTDSVDYVTTIQYATPFFLMDPLFKVDLKTTKVGSLGLIVQWFNVNPASPMKYEVHPNGSPLVVFAPDFDNGTVIQSESKVSLLALPPNMVAPDVSPYMRSMQIFDGQYITSKHVGNLYQVLVSGTNFVSTGKYLTIYTLYPGLGSIGNSIIVQDYSDVQAFKSYKAINCLPIITRCEFSLDASSGTAAAIRYHPTDIYIKDVSMPQTNILSVYTDFVTPAHKLADYTSTTAKTNTPQKIHGVFTSFVLNKDQAEILMSSDANDANWDSGFDNRSGFFYSPNYSFKSSSQDFSDKITSSKLSNISYTIDRSAIAGDSTLTVTILNKQKAVIDNTYSTKNFPGGPVSAIGDTISVSYKSNNAWTTGAYVNFMFGEYNSATTNGIIIGFMVTILRILY